MSSATRFLTDTERCPKVTRAHFPAVHAVGWRNSRDRGQSIDGYCLVLSHAYDEVRTSLFLFSPSYAQSPLGSRYDPRATGATRAAWRWSGA